MRRLITIPISHYCEKARWALERAGLSYREERHVQMAHWPHALRAGGSKAVPVLVAEGSTYAESSDIVRYTDRHVTADRELYPDAHAYEIRTLEQDFDTGLGVESRRLVYGLLSLPGGRKLLRINNQGVPYLEAWLLRMTFPLARAFLLRYLDVNETTMARAHERIQRTLDRVALRLKDGRPYLFGDRFTAADLCFAVMSAPLCLPPNYGVPLHSRSQAIEHDPSAGLYWDHPAIKFADRIFATERDTHDPHCE